MDVVIVGIVGLICFFAGAITLIGYILWRMMRTDGWDDSNVTNALRLLSHVTIHADDFGKMVYLTSNQYGELITAGINPAKYKRPFWYISEDEFEGVVKTRPY